MVVTGKERDYAGQILRTLSNDIFQSGKFIERQVSNRGGHRTKLLNMDDAISLVMVLPGDNAKGIRQQFARIIRRHFAGDQTLHAEIDANAASSSPIAQLARDSMDPSEEQLVGFKRRREELELFKLEHEINTLIVENRAKEQARIMSANAELERIRDPTRTNLDERTRLMYQDTLQNLFLNTQVVPPASGGTRPAISNGPSPNAPISISSVAASLGYKPTSDDSKRIGMDLRKRYVKQHGKPPPKHDQLCDGRVTSVNSYTEQDRELMTQTLHDYFHVESDAE
jgi:hypothetical protein